MTRKQAISFAYGNMALVRNWQGTRQQIVDQVNATPDDQFDPEDPVGDAGVAVCLLARLEGTIASEDDVAYARDIKANELLEEFLSES